MKVAALWFHWSCVRITEEGDPKQRNTERRAGCFSRRPGIFVTRIVSEQEVRQAAGSGGEVSADAVCSLSAASRSASSFARERSIIRAVQIEIS